MNVGSGKICVVEGSEGRGNVHITFYKNIFILNKNKIFLFFLYS